MLPPSLAPRRVSAGLTVHLDAAALAEYEVHRAAYDQALALAAAAHATRAMAAKTALRGCARPTAGWRPRGQRARRRTASAAPQTGGVSAGRDGLGPHVRRRDVTATVGRTAFARQAEAAPATLVGAAPPAT